MFLRFVTERDATGFPLKGSFGINFSCRMDLRTVAPAERKEAVKNAIISEDPGKTERSLNTSVSQMLGTYDSFHPGTLVALKKGTNVIAFARIVSEYRYEDALFADNTPHRWDYEIIRKAHLLEKTYKGNQRITYVPKGVPLPVDLIAPTLPAAPAEETGDAAEGLISALIAERDAMIEREDVEIVAEARRRIAEEQAAILREARIQAVMRTLRL